MAILAIYSFLVLSSDWAPLQDDPRGKGFVSAATEDARRNAKSKTNISTICFVGKFLAVRLSFFLWHPVALRVGASLLAHFDDVRVSVVL